MSLPATCRAPSRFSPTASRVVDPKEEVVGVLVAQAIVD
jgi:hypothetical protein